MLILKEQCRGSDRLYREMTGRKGEGRKRKMSCLGENG